MVVSEIGDYTNGSTGRRGHLGAVGPVSNRSIGGPSGVPSRSRTVVPIAARSVSSTAARAGWMGGGGDRHPAFGLLGAVVQIGQRWRFGDRGESLPITTEVVRQGVAQVRSRTGQAADPVGLRRAIGQFGDLSLTLGNLGLENQ